MILLDFGGVFAGFRSVLLEFDGVLVVFVMVFLLILVEIHCYSV